MTALLKRLALGGSVLCRVMKLPLVNQLSGLAKGKLFNAGRTLGGGSGLIDEIDES